MFSSAFDNLRSIDGLRLGESLDSFMDPSADEVDSDVGSVDVIEEAESVLLRELLGPRVLDN